MISKDDVLHTAKLAKIRIPDNKIEAFQKDLSEIFDWIDQLQNVDTQGVSPTSQVTGLYNNTRTDDILNGSSSKSLLDCTPHTVEKHQIRIPKVF